ncbi:PREDICTED: putative HTLV-1-related endogenous sequence, partial [Gekko japonicus]|uniref:HTLV-1-related endogenous sequence n=1 Tax=Gekko japonicus TaxID=146911 RepID=A0ABM1JWV7_GEKJA
ATPPPQNRGPGFIPRPPKGLYGSLYPVHLTRLRPKRRRFPVDHRPAKGPRGRGRGEATPEDSTSGLAPPHRRLTAADAASHCASRATLPAVLRRLPPLPRAWDRPGTLPPPVAPPLVASPRRPKISPFGAHTWQATAPAAAPGAPPPAASPRQPGDLLHGNRALQAGPGRLRC